MQKVENVPEGGVLRDIGGAGVQGVAGHVVHEGSRARGPTSNTTGNYYYEQENCIRRSKRDKYWKERATTTEIKR